jgi:long-chain acyl-CoA synthetase
VNVADVVRSAAERSPAKAAIVFRGHAVTYQDLDERIEGTAAALASLGVRPGDRVAILTGNIPEFVDALYGSMRAGAVAVPLNPMLTAHELAAILSDAQPVAVVTELEHLAELTEARSDATAMTAGTLTVIVVGGPPAPAGTVSLEEAMARAAQMPGTDSDEGDTALIAYTAGTTAEPKGAMLTHGNLLANLEQVASVPAFEQAHDDVVLLALPLSHIYALNGVLGLFMKAGGTAILVERFDPVATAQLIRDTSVTALFGAPPMFAAWLEALRDGRVERAAFGTVRLAVSGAAGLSPEVQAEFLSTTGVTIWQGYGLTESAPTVSTTALGDEARPGSIGLVLPGIELRLLDEDGEDAEEGDPGEILVRGPNVFAGYWNRPQETADVLDADGWLHTGDVAYRDDDGYLHLVDRKKDLIIVSGFNVYPKEVEDAIASSDAVADVAVVGVHDDRTGEAVEAWVVPAAGHALTPDDVRRHIEHRLARFKMPKIVNIVDDLPKHVTGKVLRRALRNSDDPEAS